MKQLLSGCLAILLLISCSKEKPAPPRTPPPVDSVPVVTVPYLQLAKETHQFVLSNLITQYHSYRANTTSASNSAFEWYHVSQIYADAAMVAAGETAYATYMNNTFAWMDNMWDHNDPNGGYFAACNLNGSGAGGDKYVDDNGLTGMVYLEAYDITTGTQRDAYFNQAKACGDWIINSGLWDDTYEGGFWWSTAKTFKPTQANGIALQLF